VEPAPIRTVRRPRRPKRRSRTRFPGPGCFLALVIAGVALLILGVFLLFPFRTNILVLGIDYTKPGNAVGRSDTIVLTTFLPLRPYVGMLSIPRDLWVAIPGAGENRINTAHFFAESQQAGQGPYAAMETIRQNFGVKVNYYVRIKFDSVRDIVNAMGGVDITLSEPTAGYEPGTHHLTGNKALAFARNRMGSDDFFRMEHGQILMRSIFRQMLNPLKWPRLPAVLIATYRSVDTNLPFWLWPRLGLALLRVGPEGIDSRTISREMAAPVVTAEGANILVPNWAIINPVLMEMFGQ